MNVDLDVGVLPSFNELVHLCKKMKKCGLGEDLLGGELGAAFPFQIATLLYPLIFKSVVGCCPPIQWRGGQIHEIYKKKGSLFDVKSFRDVLLSNFGGKIFHRFLRGKSKKLLERQPAKPCLDPEFAGPALNMRNYFAKPCMDMQCCMPNA